jgi:hypothetical protein
VKVGGSEKLEVTQGVDDFALLFVLRIFHSFDGKLEWFKEDKYWNEDQFMRIALFCNKYAVDRNEIRRAVLQMKWFKNWDNPESAIQIGRRHGHLGLDTDWLTVAWVFGWRASFKLMWKYLVATSSFTDHGRLGYDYYDMENEEDMVDWRRWLFEGLDMEEPNVIFGVLVDAEESPIEESKDEEETKSGDCNSVGDSNSESDSDSGYDWD